MSFSAKSITSLILVVGAVVLGYFVVLPRWNAYSAAKQVLATNQEHETQLEQSQTQLDAFLAEYKAHTADAQTLNQALPLSRPQIYDVLNSLDVLTAQSGLALGATGFQDTPQSDTLNAASDSIQPIDMTLSVSGDYNGFKNFISLLETNLRLIDVNSVSIHSGTAANVLDFTISLRTYYQQ
ncbi:MAG TPA: type 4a pilus biogenesis protein PilO [Patescibacteria group bacterium]|nr:type 4a pilus biogenesis protein PilO [Patescibacteria group bacterium]